MRGNLYVEYAASRLPGLMLNAGGRYVGNEAVEADNSSFIGAYHTFDIGALQHLAARPCDHLPRRHRQPRQRKYWLTNWGFMLNQGTPRTTRASVTLTL